MKKPIAKDIDSYIAECTEEVRPLLQQLRALIHEEAPDATETISYGIPTFKLKRNLVHFSAAKNHIGFYPSPSGIDAFRDELGSYRLSKGTIQFPLDTPLPLELIRKIVRFRVGEEHSE